MKFLQKIVILFAIVAALFFVSYETPVSVVEITSEKQNSLEIEGLHAALPFIQPQADHHIVSENKTGGAFFAKWLVNNFTFKVGFILKKPVQSFLFQDFDRCETVSLLLFPFHYFW